MANKIHPTAIIGPNVELGDNNEIGPYCIIGTQAEDHKAKEVGKVVIGDGNIFYKQNTIDASTVGITTIGNNNTFLKNSHLGHDGHVEDNCIISCSVLIGGHTKVMEGANLALGSIVHQRCVVGPYAMLGMGSVATKKTLIEPFKIYVGSPAKHLKRNYHIIEKLGLSPAEMQLLIERFNNEIKNCSTYSNLG